IRDFHVTGVQTCALPIFKWKNIIAKGVKKYEFQDLHSNGSYYNAFMELDNDTLRISVGHTGAGNEQKWVRTYTEPVTELNECIRSEERRVGKEWRTR